MARVVMRGGRGDGGGITMATTKNSVTCSSPLLRDGKLIFGGEQRRDQDICL